MPDKADSSRMDSENGEAKGTRREFLKKSARAAYVAPLVATFSVADIYDEESGYALAQGMTQPAHHHAH
jgi:hypothetical protein